MPSTLPSVSTEYVYVTVTSRQDPTANTVSFAFKTATDPVTEPSGGDYSAGAWASTPVQSGRQYLTEARYLITAGALAGGDWTVWVKVTGSTEIPQRAAGTLTIT